MVNCRILLVSAMCVAGCAVSIGVLPAGPGIFTVSERRAPFLGGGPAAQQAALAEADSFCRQQGQAFVPVQMGPVGNPYSPYGPTGFTATFRCMPPGDPAVAGRR